MKKVVVIGDDSYIALNINRKLTDFDVVYLKYYNCFDDINILLNADCIINFSISPNFSLGKMEEDEILDIKIAKLIANKKIHYIFLSSRKVYGMSDDLLIHKEDDPLQGSDWYSKNKIYTERKLSAILHDSLSILRISNIIGEPINRLGYKTFIGWICESFLKNGQIIFNQNSNSMKDFVTKDFIHECIYRVIDRRLIGIFNVSAGFPTSVKHVVLGYVSDKNIVFKADDLKCTDQFILDNSKILSALGINFTIDDVNSYLLKCNKQLLDLKSVVSN